MEKDAVSNKRMEKVWEIISHSFLRLVEEQEEQKRKHVQANQEHVLSICMMNKVNNLEEKRNL